MQEATALLACLHPPFASATAVAWWMWPGPAARLAALAPTAATLLTLAVLLGCLGVAGAALTRRMSATPPRVLPALGNNP